jgi:hypothetical protein
MDIAIALNMFTALVETGFILFVKTANNKILSKLRVLLLAAFIFTKLDIEK